MIARIQKLNILFKVQLVHKKFDFFESGTRDLSQ